MSRLYRPSIAEIRATMARIHESWPHLGGYAERAEQILLNFDIFYRHGWRVYASSDGIESYRLTANSCTCPSATARRTPRIHGRSFCKHKIAYLAYVRILRGELRNRWIGSDGNAPNIRLLRDYPNVFVALDLSSGECRAEERRALDVRVRTASDGGIDFASERSAYHFSLWLASTAEPVPTPRPDRVEWNPTLAASGQWSPQFSSDEFDRWLESGELPGTVPAWMKDQI